ncbi:hypothetical protein ANN_16643 [Periplaneta americana]|uniref:Mos1 transposase HTH domain-containing protein n=1 Tax=Periplaneta americana TaxID=6978 RepID=A0ABQ8SS29_PERAM|nr:hypothetical protein ANN_16643 [Periplaneta americana]
MVDNNGSFQWRAVIKFLVKEEKSAAEVHLRLQRAYGDMCMGASSVRRCVKYFQRASKMSLVAAALELPPRNATRKDFEAPSCIARQTLWKEIILQHDNAWPHTDRVTVEKIRTSGWETLPQCPYSPDLALSDYHLFGSVEQLRGQRYETLEDIRKAVRQCLQEAGTDFYRKGIFEITERWEKCVQRNGDYVEKNINTERERERGKNTLDVEEAASNPKAKSVLSSDNIYGSLAFLKAHFSDLPKYIEYLESSLLQLDIAIGVIYSLLQKQASGPVGEAVTLKLKKVLQRNPRFEKVKNVCSTFQGESFNCQLPWVPAAVAGMKFAPMTSCAVKRTFSSSNVF